MTTRPWELQDALRPWEQQQGVYLRTISIYRQAANAPSLGAAGPLGYQEAQTVSGSAIWATTPVFTCIGCSIQERERGQRPDTALPGSTVSVPTTRIFIPSAKMAKGGVLVRDFVLDDLGVKYHVINPYWNGLGYRLYCEILEA